jgi:transcription termination factor Rho
MDAGTTAVTPLSTESAPAAEATTPRKPRRSTRSAAQEVPSSATAASTDAAQPSASGASSSTTRRRRGTAATPAAEAAPEQQSYAAPAAESPTTAHGTRTTRARHAARSQTEAEHAPDATASEPVTSSTPRATRARRAVRQEQAEPAAAQAEAAPALPPQAAMTEESPSQPAEARPAVQPSPYRFGRRTATPVAPGTSPAATIAEPAAESAGGVAESTRPVRRLEPREVRPAERGMPPAPGGMRGPSPRTNGHPRGPQPTPARGPYMPGGRGQAPAGRGQPPTPPAYEPSAPYMPPSGVPAGGPPVGGGYAPYPPYDPYAPYPGGQPSERMGGQPRGGRGRGYPGQPGPGEMRDQRGGRGPRGAPMGGAPMDGYREDQRGGRGPYPGRGGRGPERRGGIPGGRQPGRPPREPREVGGYPGALYTPVPSGPGAPSGVPESRYAPEHRYTPPMRPTPPVRTVEVSGILWLGGGHGMSPAEVLDGRTLTSVARLNPEDARRMGLRSGDEVRGRAEERGGRRVVVAIESVNDRQPEELHDRPVFEQLTASFPDRRIHLEQGPLPVSCRIIDLFAPLGFGSRALIVAPPKTGKTTLIREAAEAVLKGYPDAVVMAVLVGERPEEVTDLRSRLEPRGGLVYAASFDEDTQRHAWLVQVAVERAKRVAESGRDAFMVLDSLTRLARAENLASRGAGRTLSGGIDAQALDTGRRAFGAARNLEEGGSLTILATCLVDTGSRQDDVVYEEFKGTGNMELHLSRELAQRRLFPAVDAVKSGTRREEMLLTPEELRAATALRRKLADLPTAQATQQLLSVMERTPSNAALLQAIEQSGWMSGVR